MAERFGNHPVREVWMRRRLLLVLELERGYAFYSKHPYGTNRNQLWQRFVYALLEICKKADDPAYRPAAEALRRVRRGEYVLRGGPPQHREDRRRAREG